MGLLSLMLITVYFMLSICPWLLLWDCLELYCDHGFCHWSFALGNISLFYGIFNKYLMWSQNRAVDWVALGIKNLVPLEILIEKNLSPIRAASDNQTSYNIPKWLSFDWSSTYSTPLGWLEYHIFNTSFIEFTWYT